MILSFKYRLYPTKAQTVFLEGQLREACDLYNCALQERRDAWKVCRKSIQFLDQSRQLPEMRKENLVGLTNARCCYDVLKRVDKAYKSFFNRIKNGKNSGFPRYKSSKRYNSITFPTYGNGCKLINLKLYVQGCGHIKIKLHRPVEGILKTATIKREINKWYITFICEIEPSLLQYSSKQVGLDVGLTSFATLSDGSKIDNPRFFEKSSAKLRRSNRKLARRKNGSNRRDKARILFAKVHEKVRSQRTDFHHKLSNSLINQYGLLSIENLSIMGLTHGVLAKQVRDAGWGLFINKLTYKAERAGRQLIKVNPRGTSQICICGNSVPKSLDDRWHSCHNCGLESDRDHVSAQVILQRAGIQPSVANVEVVNSSVYREVLMVQ